MKGMSATEFEKHAKIVEKSLKKLVDKRAGLTGIHTAYGLYKIQADKGEVVALTFQRFCLVAEAIPGYSIYLSIPKTPEPNWSGIARQATQERHRQDTMNGGPLNFTRPKG